MILSRDLNQAILTLAPSHSVRDVAPYTWRQVNEASSVNHVTVWSGEASHSIYGDSSVNYAFRAWHDRAHLRIGASFNIAGEESAVAQQCLELRQAFPSAPQWWQDAIAADVLGVVYYLHSTGLYVKDQASHVVDLLSRPNGLAMIKPSIERRQFAYGE